MLKHFMRDYIIDRHRHSRINDPISNSVIVDISTMDIKMEDVWKAGLDEHNRFRRIYRVPDLIGDSTMHTKAWQHAHFLATTNSFLPPSSRNYANMIAVSFKETKKEAVLDAVRKWMDSKNCYDFLNSQVAHLGIGVAKSMYGHKWVVVAYYDLINPQ